MNHKTEQENFWAGEFGNNYIERNQGASLIASNTALFSSILQRATPIDSVIEFGANIGMNLVALRNLLPSAHFHAVEINPKAAKKLSAIDQTTVYNESILDFTVTESFDLSLIKGVLIHINPDELHTVYETLYNSSNRYICIAEYYNPYPVELDYRGHPEKLFKRDFAGELMDLYPDIELRDYGFSYRRDPIFPGGDLNWFLLEKR